MENFKKLIKEQNKRDNILESAIHELRIPLNVVLGSIDILDKRGYLALQKDGFQLLNNAQDGGELLSSLVGNILDFKKFKRGNFTSKHEKCNIRKLIWKIFKCNSTNATRKGIVLEFQVEEEVPIYLSLDKSRLI